MAAVVLDIEGTVCPISFVHDVLFPYALLKCDELIPQLTFPLQPTRSELESYLAAFPAEFCGNSATLLQHIHDLVDRDVKIGYLKSLQGYLWQSGYASGQIESPLFEDAVIAMRNWAKHTKVFIYSSGSVQAQQLLFQYTNHGDLRPLIAGYFDTQNGGPKTEPQSYHQIAKAIKAPLCHFYSDNPQEIDAAHAAGWITTFVVRPGNPVRAGYQWPDNMAEQFV